MSTSSIRRQINRQLSWLAGLALLLGAFLLEPHSANAATPASGSSGALTWSPDSQSLLLAQATLDGAVNKFYDMVKVLLNLVAFVMICWAGFLYHDGKAREGTYAILGAFVVVIARIIVNALASTAT